MDLDAVDCLNWPLRIAMRLSTASMETRDDKGVFLHKHAPNSIDSRLQGQFRQIASLAGILMSFSLTSLRSTSKV